MSTAVNTIELKVDEERVLSLEIKRGLRASISRFDRLCRLCKDHRVLTLTQCEWILYLSCITLTYKRFEVMDPIRGHVYNKPEEDNRVTEKQHDELST